MVWTCTPSTPIVVDNMVGRTLAMTAGTHGLALRSVRMKTIPVSDGAGVRVSDTPQPE